MSWKLLSSPKTTKVTKAIVKEFADMEPAPRDRPLSERRVEVYKKIAEQGGFRPLTWASAKCGETGSVYRVNGKHTSTMLSRLDKLPDDLYVTVDRYYCDELDDVAKLYATFDSRLQSRNTADINRSFASCVPELGEVAARTINLVVSGIAFHQYGTDYSRLQPAERAEALLEHHGFAVWAHNLFGHSDNTNPHMKRVAVFAAMFGSYCVSKSDAEKFWVAVMEETGTSPNLPDRKLARFLLLYHSKKASGSDKSARYRVTDKEYYVKCVHAWNAWRKGETTNLNYFADAKIPKMV